MLDAHLANRDYLGEGFSIADVALGCGFEGAEERGVAFAAYPHARTWRERLRGRAAWRD